MWGGKGVGTYACACGEERGGDMRGGKGRGVQWSLDLLNFSHFL
jgi:hypothetical protein